MGNEASAEAWHHHLAVNWTTHHASYGQQSIPSITRAMRRLADAYPDASGKVTAISAALDVKFVQAYILHGAKKVAAGSQATASAEQR